MKIPNWATMHVMQKLQSRAHYIGLDSSTRITVDDRWKIAVSRAEKPRQVRKNPEWQFWLPADFAELDFVVCVTANYDCFVIPTDYIVLDAMHINITWPRTRKQVEFSRFHEKWLLVSDIPGPL